MLRKKLRGLLLLLITINSFSQSKVAVEDILKISAVAPGIGFEKKIGKLQTIHTQVFMSTNWGVGYSSSAGNTSFIYASPAAGLQYRYYYNGTRREGKEKRIIKNSMNYIGPLYTMAFSSRSISGSYEGEYKRRPVHTVVLAWGMQRNYAERFSIDCNGGLGVVFANTSLYDQDNKVINKSIASAFTYNIQIRIGWWLGQKK